MIVREPTTCVFKQTHDSNLMIVREQTTCVLYNLMIENKPLVYLNKLMTVREPTTCVFKQTNDSKRTNHLCI